MQVEYRDISKSQPETFCPPPERKQNRTVSYEPDLKIFRRAFDDAISVAELNNVTSALEAFRRFTRNIFPMSEKQINHVAGRKHYIWRLRNDLAQIKLKREKPLEITFEKGEELITAYNEKFNLSGVGTTREEALKDLSEFFIHDYLSYKNTPPEKLSKEAKSLLLQYEDVIDTCNEL